VWFQNRRMKWKRSRGMPFGKSASKSSSSNSKAFNTSTYASGDSSFVGDEIMSDDEGDEDELDDDNEDEDDEQENEDEFGHGVEQNPADRRAQNISHNNDFYTASNGQGANGFQISS
jgi:hypothetical protein